MASLPAVFNAQQFTDLGELAASYRLYTYAAGTTTHKAAWTNEAGTVAHTYTSDGAGGQYIALNARGELPAGLYLSDGGYDLALKTPAGVTVWTRPARGAGDYANQAASDLSTTVTAQIAAAVAAIGSTHKIVSAFTGAAIQAAIDACNTAGGGSVWLPTGTYVLGTVGLVMYANVTLEGAASAYVSTTRGVLLTYSGTGAVIRAAQADNVHVKNLSIDASSATGTAVIGVDFADTWRSSCESVRVKGVTKTKGYGFLLRNSSNTWYSQHNELNNCECSDGVARFTASVANSLSPGGDVLTTCVVRTFRGLQYEVDNAQVVFINATAEMWTTGAGYLVVGPAAVAVLVGCDIEGTGSPGISIGGGAQLFQEGTSWGGFTGAARVVGNAAPLYAYGGALTLIRDGLVAGTAVDVVAAGNQALPSFAKLQFVPTDVSGGSQEGYWREQRMLKGSSGTSAMVVSRDGRYMFDLYTVVASVAHNAATPVLAIAIPASTGARINITAIGSQPGNRTYTKHVQILTNNNGGVVDYAIGAETQSNTLLATNQFTCSIGGSNTLTVLHQNGGTTAGTVAYIIEVRGNITGYTLYT